jgi:hypothetical protein
VENIAPQREDHPRHWSTGDIVKVRSKTADNWRDSYVVIEPPMRSPWPRGGEIGDQETEYHASAAGAASGQG